MKYGFLGPAGSNMSYIALTITGKTTPALAYHYNHDGGHSKESYKPKKWFGWTHWSDDLRTFLRYKEHKLVQILCVDKLEFILLNWFEKHSRREDHDRPYLDYWIEQQKLTWRSVCDSDEDRLIRATLHWFYKIHNKSDPDIIDFPEIKHKFYFNLFYDNNFESLANEFKKYDVIYTEKMYSDWLTSQKIIFDSHEKIVSLLETPKDLDSFWQKGIALGLHGKRHGLNELQAWKRYEQG